jgi:hypothetical protein
MKSIREIIAYNKERMKDCEDEIARIQKLRESKAVTTDDHDKWIEGWRETRAFCRDTIAYLTTLEHFQKALKKKPPSGGNRGGFNTTRQ